MSSRLTLPVADPAQLSDALAKPFSAPTCAPMLRSPLSLRGALQAVLEHAGGEEEEGFAGRMGEAVHWGWKRERADCRGMGESTSLLRHHSRAASLAACTLVKGLQLRQGTPGQLTERPQNLQGVAGPGSWPPGSPHTPLPQPVFTLSWSP